jgi:hypothetical protein
LRGYFFVQHKKEGSFLEESKAKSLWGSTNALSTLSDLSNRSTL